MATDPTVLPTWQDAKAYLGADTSWSDAEITDAFDAEIAAQARVCRVTRVDATDPANPVTVLHYTDDLRNALNRRVAHNLALRNLPLGVQASISQAAVATNRVGGTDAEAARLEAPYRKRVIG